MELSKIDCFDGTCFDECANANFDFTKNSNFDQNVIKTQTLDFDENFDAFAPAFTHPWLFEMFSNGFRIVTGAGCGVTW